MRAEVNAMQKSPVLSIVQRQSSLPNSCSSSKSPTQVTDTGLHRQSSLPTSSQKSPIQAGVQQRNAFHITNLSEVSLVSNSSNATTHSTLNHSKSPHAAAAVPPNEEDRALFRKELDTRLSAYLPALVRKYLEQQDACQKPKIPDFHQVKVVCMFADVSGFTAMTESLAARGPVGAEYLGRHLNSYFEQLLRLVSSAGGDAFKFAGDAMVVFWAENKEDTLESLLRRCVQCALRIQTHLHQAELAPQVVLSIKMGIGIGGATIAHLGGVSDGSTSRMEYIAVGPALEQAFRSEHQAQAGDVICSPQSWQIVREYFEGEEVGDGLSSTPMSVSSSSSSSSFSCASNRGFYKVKQVRTAIKLCSRRPSFSRDDEQLHARMKQYVSRAVWPYLNANDEFWGSELRDVTVLFINLGFNEQDLTRMLDSKGLQRLQDAFAEVQRCIFEYEGTINKFLVDDKGSTVLAAFGLPPVTHENDPIRGILASLAICASLGKYGLKASVGITSGIALCGVVGHQGNRREYTILGDMVNLSARLMQKAKSERGGVITDEATKLFSQDILHFEERPEIMVKGKHDSIKIHRPYPRMSILLEYHLEATSLDGNSGATSNTNTPSLGATRRPTERSSATTDAVTEKSSPDGIKRLTPISNVMENMHRVQVRDAQRRLSLRLEQEVAQRDAIVESANFLSCRNKLLAKCSQLNRFASGGALIVEGDTGVGKTVFLRNTLSQSELGSSLQVLVATASAFVTHKSYAVWADLISKHALDTIEQEANGPDTNRINPEEPSLRAKEMRQMESRKRRLAAFIRHKIEEGAAPNTTLVTFCGLLNETFELKFDDQERSDTESKRSSRIYGYGTRNTSLYEKNSSGTKLLLCDELPDGSTNEETNNPIETEENEESQALRQEQEEEAARLATQAKEEEIATWFLGLLQMDLDANRQESDESDDTEGASILHLGVNQMEGSDGTCGVVAQSSTLTNSPSKDQFQSNGKEEEPEIPDQEACDDDDDDSLESEWKPKDLDLSGILLLCALHAISREKICVFCLDNAMYMDEKSWILTTIIAKYFTNCMVVLGMRSPSAALTEHTESSSYRKQLKLLKQLPSTVACVLEPLGDEDTEKLIGHMLHDVQTIPRNLIEILRTRSQGNPFFLREIIQEMIQQQVIVLDEKQSICIMRVQEPGADKSNAMFCFYCHLRFSSSKEKHRCKSCGYVFCGSCTPKACRKKLAGSSGDPVRHCCTCYALSSTRRRSTDRIVLPSASSSSSSNASATLSSVSSTLAALPGACTAATITSSSSAAAARARNRMLSLFVPPSSSLSSAANMNSSLTLEDRLVLRPPPAVKSVLVTWIDQLSISQRMLLKTASVIGSSFEEEVLRAACPIKEHLHRFSFDLLELQRLGVIRQVESSAESEVLLSRKQSRHQYQARKANSLPVTNNSSASSTGRSCVIQQSPHGTTVARQSSAPFKVIYRFAQGFMQEVIRSQLLLSQVDKLTTRIEDFREQQQKELRQIFFEKAKGTLTRGLTNSRAPSNAPSPLTVRTVSPKEIQATAATETVTTTSTTGVVSTEPVVTAPSAITSPPKILTPSPPKPSRRRSANVSQKKELLVLYDPAQLVETNNQSKDQNDQQRPPRRKTRPASSAQASSVFAMSVSIKEDRTNPPVPVNLMRTSRFARERRSSAGETSSTSTANSLALSSSTCCQNCGNNSPESQVIPFLRLKSGYVYVKKQSSVFAHFKWTPSSICLWKKRFAVLYNSKLVFQHGTSDEEDRAHYRHHPYLYKQQSQKTNLKHCDSCASCSSTKSSSSTSSSTSLLSTTRRFTSLSLRNAKVCGGDADMVTLSGSHKVFCLQLEVNEWAKGKTMQQEKRFFMIGLDKQREMEDWIYLLKYAIESLENNSS